MFIFFAFFAKSYAQVLLPYTADFENDEGFVDEVTLSDDWSTTDTLIVVTVDESYLGAQSILIPSANIENIVSLGFDPSGNTILFVDYYMQLAASLLPSLPTLTTPETTALVAVHDSGFGLGEWVFLDGDGLGSGAWFQSDYKIPLDESYRTGWHRITLRLNLISNTWDAYIDGILLATDLGFVEPLSVGSEAINIYGSSAGPSYLDNFSLSAVNPLFTDEDLDGMDDAFEALYGLDRSIDDRDLDPDSDGFTNLEEYKYGIDPTMSNTVVVELSENGNLTVINEADGNLQIVNDGELLLDMPLDEAYNLHIIGKENSGDIDVLLDGTLIGMFNVEGDVGTVRFDSSLSILAGLNISGANAVLFNGTVSVEGTTTIEVSEDLILDLNSSLVVMGGDLNGTVGKDLIVRGNSSVSVNTGNANFKVAGAIWLEDSSSLTVGNAVTALGNLQLRSDKSITVSDNSLIHSSNNYMVLHAEHISLVGNSVISAAEDGYVSIQTNRGDLMVVDSAISLNNNDLFLYTRGSLRAVRSAIHAETGIAQFIVFVNATLEENSNLTVNNGDLYGQVNGNLTVNDISEIVMTEGNIGLNVIGNALVERNSLLEVNNSTGSDKSLQLIVSGSTTFDSNSVLEIENTELNIFSFGDINLFNSALKISTGNTFIRTNASLTLTDSVLPISNGNLSVNVAHSMDVTNSSMTATDGSFYLNMGVDLIMDAGSTLNVTGGDLYANIFGEMILEGEVSIEQVFAMYVQGNFTVTDTGSLDALIVYLSSGQDIAIDGRMDTDKVNGQTYLYAQGYIDMTSMDPITAKKLYVVSGTGIFLRTEVEQLTAQTVGLGLGSVLDSGNYTGSAEIEIHEVDDIILDTIHNADGPIRVMAGGTIQALQVHSATDAPGHNIGLMSTGGDIEAGSVNVGTTQGQISLSANGEIRESSEFDAEADLIGNMAVVYAGTSIATGDAALEMNVNESHEFAATDVVFDTTGDVEIFMSTDNNTINVRSLQGDMIVTRAINTVGEINLESPSGSVYIKYLDSGVVGGDNIFFTMSEDGVPNDFELALSATDLNGNALNWSIHSNGNNGVASIGEPAAGNTATINYLPNSNFNGNDSFVVQVADENGNTENISVHVTVESVNDAPVAPELSFSLDEGSSVTIDLLANATDVDSPSLSIDHLTQPVHGTLTDNNDGTVTYTHDGAENFSDSFEYTLGDDSAATATAVVVLTIHPVNEAPAITSTAITSMHQGSPYRYVITADDPDAGDTVTLTVPVLPEWMRSKDGTLIGFPNDAEAGDYNVEIVATDLSGLTDTQTFTLTVHPNIITVGYYDLVANTGKSGQADAILAAGFEAVNVGDLNTADLSLFEILFVQNPSNYGYASTYTNNLNKLFEFVEEGGILIFHDRAVSSADSVLPGSPGSFIKLGSVDIQVKDHTTVVTNGPGGLIDDTTLDFGNNSSHGYVWGDMTPSGAVGILSKADPNQWVTFSYPFMEGAVVYSSIPLDYYLAGNGNSAFRDIYAPNVVAYGKAILYPDADRDGINDADEISTGTDPFNSDSDNDGLLDGFEWTNRFDPLNPDEDNNGIADGSDDEDGDGLVNLQEQNLGTDYQDADTDDDGLADGDEVTIYGTDPFGTDTDRDEMLDGEEVANGLDPLSDDAMEDLDGDGYPNIYELRNHADPQNTVAELLDTPAPTQIVDVGGSTAYTTVQAGIDAVDQDYSIVLIKAGVYTGAGNPNFIVQRNDPKMLLISESGPEATVLDGQESLRGGSILNDRSAVVGFTIRNCVNNGNYRGAGLYVTGDEALIAKCQVHHNKIDVISITEGGGIYTKGDNIRIEDCQIFSNWADIGGGLFCDSGTGLKVKNTKVYRNTATFSAGAIHVECNEVTLDKCEIYENRASRNGGGIYVFGSVGQERNILIESCDIHHNIAKDGAGLYFAQNVPGSKIQNTLVHRNNSIFKGGGIYISPYSDISVVHSTLHNNRASNGNEIYNSGGNATDVLLINSIVWNDSGSANVLAGNSISASYSIIQGTLGYVDDGTIINTDPHLNAQGLLTATSEGIAIDKGTNVSVNLDINGESRSNGIGHDIGADEFVDVDGDGLPDWLEAQGVTDPSGDEDNDNLKNLDEYELGTDIFHPDTDSDGILDGDEILIAGTNPLIIDSGELDTDLNSDGLDDSVGILVGIPLSELDNDGDTLSNIEELKRGTNPILADTDGDGVDDGIDEFPLDPNLSARPINVEDITPPTLLLQTPPQAILL